VYQRRVIACAGQDLIFPIIGVVVSAVLIVIGRTQRNNPVAIAGYIVLVLSGALYLYLRSR
jgi:hypothetical protein